MAVAARDRNRAEQFAQDGKIERVVDSYQEVIDDPEVEAIYNPLPNGLHGPWNLRAIAAGKHVFSEKPSASNAAEARDVLTDAGGPAAEGCTAVEALEGRGGGVLIDHLHGGP